MDKSTNTQAYEAFLALLRELRESKNLFQSDLAESIDEHQSFVSKCENGERRLDIIELKAWCDALGVSLVDFTKTLEKRLHKLS